MNVEGDWHIERHEGYIFLVKRFIDPETGIERFIQRNTQGVTAHEYIGDRTIDGQEREIERLFAVNNFTEVGETNVSVDGYNKSFTASVRFLEKEWTDEEEEESDSPYSLVYVIKPEDPQENLAISFFYEKDALSVIYISSKKGRSEGLEKGFAELYFQKTLHGVELEDSNLFHNFQVSPRKLQGGNFLLELPPTTFSLHHSFSINPELNIHDVYKRCIDDGFAWPSVLDDMAEIVDIHK